MSQALDVIAKQQWHDRVTTRPSLWTDEKVAELTRLWADGPTCSQIAKRLGPSFTRNAIISKVHRIGLPGRPAVVIRQPRPPSEPKASKVRTPGFKYRAPPARPVPVAAPIVPDVPAVDLAARSGAGNAIVALMNGQCHWPIGNPTAADFHFCAQPVRGELQNYCAAHSAIAYSQGRAG